MIVTHNLTRTFGEKVALDRLNLTVRPGEILGFLGPNGAGKTTTVKILTGMIKPTSGSAQVAGYDVQSQALEVKRRLGYVPESGALFESLSPLEYLDLISSLHHLDPDAAANRARQFLHLFGLSESGEVRMTEFSKGMKQKVLIAAALINQPEVLFLDEPLNGLDANSAMMIKELLRRLAEKGKTVFFSSHILEVVERVCTRIVIINEGRQVACGTVGELLQQSGSRTLDEAFGHLTGVRDAGTTSRELLQALERAQ